MSRVLIGVFSGLDPKYAPRRKACRETWFQGLRDFGFDPKFVMSRPASLDMLPADYDPADCLILDHPDTYEELPQKTRSLIQWALHQDGFEWLAKFDDDSLVIPSRFAAFCDGDLGAEVRYRGGEVGLHQGYQPYASGGGGYVLHADCCEILAEHMAQKTGYEDKLVGDILRENGVSLTQDPRFSPWPMFGIPAKDNDLITGHSLTAQQWADAWESCKG